MLILPEDGSKIYVDNFLNSDECDSIADEFKKRSHLIKRYPENHPIGFEFRQDQDQYGVTSFYKKFAEDNDLRMPRGFLFLYYRTGNHMRWHVDKAGGDKYALTVSLNDGFEGGELTFKDGSYPLKKGQGVFFEGKYKHMANQVTSGEKYVITGWFVKK